MARSNHLAVAAIDFGTTFSGWAFSFKHDYERDPANVQVKHWNSGENLSPKTPTSLLMNPDGKTLHAFGYQAENIYTDMETDEERQRYFFFRRFKMLLYNRKNIHRDMELEAANGKKVPAILVFQLAIEYLKDHLLGEYGSKVSGGLGVRDIHWCLTVPAIWNDKAKKFMREAAIRAGINSFDLTIVLEPEAASVLCRHLPVDKLDGGSMAAMQPGSTYMVVDCGGGTADVCCHEILKDNKIKEIHRASGGAVGGQDVDNAFEFLFVKIFGRAIWVEFSKENKGDVLSLFRSFEVKKRDIAHNQGQSVTFTLPTELVNIFTTNTKQDVQNAVAKARLQNVIKVLKGNKIKVDVDFLIQKTFGNVVKRLQDLLLYVFTNPMVEGTKQILLVGGLSECAIIRDAVRKVLPDKQVMTVQDPSLAVVKGAVIYGHDGSVVKSRIARYTYGNDSSEPFDPAVHQENMSYTESNGSKRVRLFETIINAGQGLPSDHVITEAKATPVREDQTALGRFIYAVDADDKIPVYIKDPRCIYLGHVTIPITNRSVPLSERGFSCAFKFGGTEISATITERSTGKTTEGCVDFLG